MATSFSNESFRETLSSLPVGQQRRVAARFIEKVLDLADERCLDNIVKLFSKAEIAPEDLEVAHHKARSIYVDTHPGSDLAELSYPRQARHFVAEACMTCVAPIYEQAKTCHLAQKVAMYCRMARTCSIMGHEGEEPDFSNVEAAATKATEEQHAILQGFLDEVGRQ